MSLKWHMDAKRRKRGTSMLDEKEARGRDRAAKWLAKVEQKPKAKAKAKGGKSRKA